MLLLLSWLALILSVSTDVFERHPLSFHTMLIPISFVASGISHVIHLPVTLPRAVYHTASSQAGKALSLILPYHHDIKKKAFVGKHALDPKLTSLINKLAAQRANRHLALQHHLALARTQDTASSNEGDNTKLKIFDSTAKGLFHLASLVDDGLNPQLTIAAPQGDDDITETDTNYQEEAEHDVDEEQQTKQLMADLLAEESRLEPLQEYATSITFDPKLDNLYLVGVGVRKKSIVKLYAVAMYSSATVLSNAASSSSLHTTARTFDLSTPSTTFVLEMVYSVGAEKIAGAIAESVKPRYSGSPSNISTLETLIVTGVNSIGGQATKGTIFRFDCSEGGVSVSVNSQVQGTASFDGLGSALVDVFMDKDAVSPTLADNCVETWSNKEAKDLSSSLVRLTNSLGGSIGESADDNEEGEAVESSDEDTADTPNRHAMIESQMKSLTDYATSVTFDPKLDDLYLIGVGVRKKSIISVYAVSMYSSAAVIEALSQFPQGKQQRKEKTTSLQKVASTFDSSNPSTTFVLEMVYSVGAEKIAGAIGESVKPRYSGSSSDINALETLIVNGVNGVGGQASKGTIFRFDCSEDGVSVSVNGQVQGTASFDGLGSAFVDVFVDDNAVSPTLVDSCLDTWTDVSLD